VLRRIKTGAVTSPSGKPIHPPQVVVLSAMADLEQINTVIALGADQYLTKPLDLDALFVVIDRLTSDRQMP